MALMATCPQGMENDRREWGQDHTTAVNPRRGPNLGLYPLRPFNDAELDTLDRFGMHPDKDSIFPLLKSGETVTYTCTWEVGL